MRLTSLKLKGFSSAFPGVIDLPLKDIDPGLVALVGENGAGKTSLLEVTPAALYRRLPARNNMSPVDFAIARDAFLELEFECGAVGTFRSRVNLDHQTRKTDAVLERVLPDGSRTPLNNGQASTFDVTIKALFPSYELFLNSSYAAQGRGDEFARATGTKRKDLFVEFLNLKRLLGMAAAAKEATALCDDARRRLEVAVEALERDTDPKLFTAIEQWADELQAKGGAAEIRQRELATAIERLHAREQLAADSVAAYAAAQLQVRTFDTELEARRRELQLSHRARQQYVTESATEITGIAQRAMQQLADIDTRIAGNQQIQSQATAIRAAVAALVALEADLVELRQREADEQTQRNRVGQDLAGAERTVSHFAIPQQALARATSDSALLATVPCGGAGEFSACQFLINASTAAARIAELEQQVAGITAAIADRDALRQDAERLDTRLASTRAAIAAAGTAKAQHEKSAKYATALAEAETRVTELQAKRAEVDGEAKRQTATATDRQQARLREFVAQDETVQAAIDRLTAQQQTAQRDLETAAAGNSQAVQLQAELVAARQEWDLVTSSLAEVASGRGELEHRRQDLATKRTRLVDARDRLTRVETELLEWQGLVKALGKGGLPDLEIDIAGPGISATTNALLLATYGPRFSLELVTQVEKADGSGLRDEFTVRVLDNSDVGGGWRDISEPSGGEKVIIQEALMCAIAMYVNERSPMPIRTLFRDESGAALSPTNAVHYIEMLRKVRELGGFHHILFISHNPDVNALADTQIQVGGGDARIVLPPFDDVRVAA